MVCERLVGFISTGALAIILVTSYYAIYLWKVNLDRTQLNIESAATENSVVFASDVLLQNLWNDKMSVIG
jgi:hypothetical protein